MTSLSALANIASYLATNEDRPPPSEVLSNYSSPKDDRQVYTTTSSTAASSTAMPLASSSSVAKKKPLKKRSIHNTTNDHSNNHKKKARNTTIVAPTVHTSPQTSVQQGNMSIKNQYGSRLSQWLYDSDDGTSAIISFPTILMGILSAPQNSDCITFLSDDCNFIIIDPEGLGNILPQYFENTAPTSDEFIQLLTLWGFTIAKDPQYPHVQLYTHPMFRRGDWEACLNMKLPPGTSCPPPKKKKRQKNTASTLLGLSPPPKKARSVTPPEIVFRPAPPITTLLPYHDIAKSLPEESAAEWLAQSAMLEQMIAATKESRRRLSMTDEMSPSTATLLEMADAKQPELINKTSMSSIPYQDGDAASISSTLSDSEVQKMTTDVVSAAIAALNQSKVSSSRGSTTHEKIMRGDSSSLSAMTEDFIQRSNSRRMQSRPAGIYGARGQSSHSTLASLRSQLSDQVDAQTKVMLKRTNKRGSKKSRGVYMV